LSDVAAAAAAMGVPEALVKRSAEARAKATGASADEILAAWAGGAPAPEAPSATEQRDAGRQKPGAGEEPATPPSGEEDVQKETGTPGPPATPPLVPAASSVVRPASMVASPPVLVGDRQGVGVLMTGSLGLLVLSLLLSVFLPSMPQPGNGIRSSNQSYSSQAREGRDIYLSQGCGTCHTQLIRNVVPDVGLGPVSLPDTNQVIGYRRIGPDLAAIGGRIQDTDALMALLAGEGNHPQASGLTEADLVNLLAYLRESR
jgi:hypothetical protein